MSDTVGPRRRSTHVSSDGASVADDLESTVMSGRRAVAASGGGVADTSVDEDFDESTIIAPRRARAAAAVEADVADGAGDDDDLDESTVIATRRAVQPEPDPGDDDDELDESTVIATRRTGQLEPELGDDDDLDESTVIATRRAVQLELGDDDLDEVTVIGRRRSVNPATPDAIGDDGVVPAPADAQSENIEATQLGRRELRRAEAQASADDLEPTDPGRRRAQSAPHPADDVTAVSKRRSGLEATIKSLRKPKPNPPAKIETLSLATRRTTQILDDGGLPVAREAFTPEEAILKAPYKPRKQTMIPVVHLDRQLDTRPPKPFADSMNALARQRAAARRRVTVMALVGGGTMVLSVGGIIALLLLG